MFSPGCKCCGCNPVNTLVCFTILDNCSSAAISGASVTLKDSGGTTVGTATTNGSGQCCIGVSKKDTYSATITASGYCDATDAGIVVNACVNTYGQTVRMFPTTVVVHATGCCGAALPGASVTITQGGTISSGTTDSSGNVTLTAPCTGTYTVTVSKTRFVTNSTTAGANSCSVVVSLAPDTGYVCVGCADPIPTTLSGTSATGGAFTLTYDGVASWFGSLVYNSPPCLHFSTLCPGGNTTVTYRLDGDCVSGMSLSSTFTEIGPPPNAFTTCPGGSTTVQPDGSFSLTVVCPPTFSVSGTSPGSSAYCASFPGDTVTITE